jgi:hypothetical protein
MTASTSVRSTVYTCPPQAGRDRLRRDKSLENVLRTAQKQRFHRSKVVRGTGIESVTASQTARTLSPNLLSPNLCRPVATGTTATATFGIGARSPGGGLAVARTLTKKGGASTASCQGGFEGGTRPHADFLDMCVISPPVRGTRSARRCPLRTPLGQELQ